MPPSLRDRRAVLKACAEYDRLGQERFLGTYGFGEATRYLLRVEGTRGGCTTRRLSLASPTATNILLRGPSGLMTSAAASALGRRPGS